MIISVQRFIYKPDRQDSSLQYHYAAVGLSEYDVLVSCRIHRQDKCLCHHIDLHS